MAKALNVAFALGGEKKSKRTKKKDEKDEIQNGDYYNPHSHQIMLAGKLLNGATRKRGHPHSWGKACCVRMDQGNTGIYGFMGPKSLCGTLPEKKDAKRR